jgi:acyl-CoA synthetase (AMP-forming)/AMP-acid ligase II
MTVGERFRASVLKHPQRPAYADDRGELRYEQLWQRAASAAAALGAEGVASQDRIAILAGEGSDYLVALMGLWLLGAVPIPINRAQTEDKTRFILSQSDPRRVLVAHGEPMAALVDPDKQIPLARVLAVSDAGPAPDVPLAPCQDEQANAMILYTSGTTGTPKGVLHSQRALVLNAVEMSEFLELDKEDRLFLNIPFYFSNSISHILMCLFNGACLCAAHGFLFADALLEQVRALNANVFGGVPAHYVRIADAFAGQALASPVTKLVNSGDHLPINVLKTLRECFGNAQIYCVYGISECAPRVCCLEPARLDEKVGSVGRPLPATSVSIRDESGEALPAGELGEIHVLSECLMREYFAAPEITARSITEHGFATGDMGYLDEEGYLFITGRLDSVFKSGGEKVSCRLIEETLRDAPVFEELLEDLVVLPESDHYLGHVPVAYYKPRSGEPVPSRPLRQALKLHLPASHIPNRFVAVREVPRSPSGKVEKARLRDTDNHLPA